MSRLHQRTRRILRLLQRGPLRVKPGNREGTEMLLPRGRHPVAAETELLRQLAADGLVRRRGDELSLLAAGKDWLTRQGDGEDGLACQHGAWNGQHPKLNLAESPLAALARIRGKLGLAWLSEDEVHAGERLRADFTHAGLSPRTGVNWDAAGTSASGGAAELADSVVAARLRVRQALTAVGPELAGVLLDVCCFLKGLAQVELERGWPTRSAKLMLRAGLAALSRHYFPEATRRREGVRHWGAAGYRPTRFSGS